MPWTNKPEIQLRTRNLWYGTSTEWQKVTAKNDLKGMIVTIVYLASSTETDSCVLSESIRALSTFLKLKVLTVVSESYLV